jgi:hypothetical protein
MNKSKGNSIQVGGSVLQKKNGSMQDFASYKQVQMTFTKEKANESIVINGKDIRPNVSESTLPCLNFPYLIFIC